MLIAKMRASRERLPINPSYRLQTAYLVCEPHQKLSQLVRLLKCETIAKKFIVYFATCACVDYFYKVTTYYFLALIDSFRVHY